jgi:hypothetical protein
MSPPIASASGGTAILQGIAKRAIDGTAAGADAAAQGRLSRPLAEQAWMLAQSLGA